MNAKPADLARAVSLLQAGELVAFPTETVYGLGADAANPIAVGKIFAAKGRPADHPLIVHLTAADALDQWAAEVPDLARQLAATFWPGPLTLILKRAPAVPLAVTGGQETVGLRVPAHPLALALLRAYAQVGGGAGGMCGIAAPSANRFGRISPTEAAHVRAELGDRVPLILDGGRCPVGIESTILDLSQSASPTPRLLRPGHITREQIAAVTGSLPAEVTDTTDGDRPRVSGSLAAHYAPHTVLHLISGQQLQQAVAAAQNSGRRCAVLCHTHLPDAPAPAAGQRLPNHPAAYAEELYSALRRLDALAADLIIVETPPATPPWAAVADRLRRAACGAGEVRSGDAFDARRPVA